MSFLNEYTIVKLSILDAFASPRQNPFEIRYLSRIHDDSDPRDMGYDFFSFNFDEQIDFKSAGGVVYRDGQNLCWAHFLIFFCQFSQYL